MRILLYEFVSGGGYAGRVAPASLVREGIAMRTALVADLAAIGGHHIVTAMDPRFARPVPVGVEVVPACDGHATAFDTLVSAVDAVWLVAPETGGCLARLAARVERRGVRLLGSRAAAIRHASDKACLPRRLARIGVRHPESIVLAPGDDARAGARHLGYPLVVKPARGAGSHGVRRVRGVRELRRALGELVRASALSAAAGWRAASRVVMQRYVSGSPASVSLLCDGRTAVALAVNAQQITVSAGFVYRGGRTPLDHPHAAAAVEAAVRTCAALPGLRGYVGVDLVLTDEGPVIIEVNPRVTTAYLGVRAVLDENVAALAIAACEGVLPPPPVVRRSVRFTASGLVAAA